MEKKEIAKSHKNSSSQNNQAKQNKTAKSSPRRRTQNNKSTEKELVIHDAVLSKNPRQQRPAQKSGKPTVKIIPLGGIGEVGKNITVYDCMGDIIIVDSGLMFPDETMLGIDIVLPDYTFLEQNKERVRAIFITHGHEDHIGGLTYLLKVVNAPVYATRLTLGLIKGKLAEANMTSSVKLVEIKAGDAVKAGCMSVEPVRVNHSIPDAVAFAITTPVGVIVQTGDFKVDYTPVSDKVIDLTRFGELGRSGVLALLSDSTNSERPGFTPSESVVRHGIESIVSTAKNKRIVIATFASNIQRIQQFFSIAEQTGRKVAISGRSMINNITIAHELGYLKFDDSILIEPERANNYPSDKVMIITTGSQGEALSALSRMANASHRSIIVGSDDVIIISATPIPGNEKTVNRVINDLMKKGCEVVYESMYDIHVSGHACQEDQKLIMTLVKPKYFIPVHGEYKHIMKHAKTAHEVGIPEKNTIIPEIGRVIELNVDSVNCEETVASGRVLVDGFGVGDVGSIVLRDRKHLAQDGLVVVAIGVSRESKQIVSGPDMISRGFVYVRESEELMDDARAMVIAQFESSKEARKGDWNAYKNKLKDSMAQYMYQKLKRSPMVLPIIVEV